MNWLRIVPLIGSARGGVGIWRDARSRGSIGNDSALPSLLEKKW